MTVGALRPGAEVVLALPEELERLGVDQPVVGEPIGWGWLVLGWPVEVVDGRAGAGRPLITDPDVDVRVGAEVVRGVV
ncbi:MAG: hypothetical protein P8R46_12370 [Planctomycetota bacterium]|nr:hypothetical protein [Planctomycetota bacterium]